MSARRAKKGRDCQSVKTCQRQGTAGIVRALKHASASQRVKTPKFDTEVRLIYTYRLITIVTHNNINILLLHT